MDSKDVYLAAEFPTWIEELRSDLFWLDCFRSVSISVQAMDEGTIPFICE